MLVTGEKATTHLLTWLAENRIIFRMATKTKKISVILSATLERKLRVQAARDGKLLSAYVREILAAAVRGK